MTDKLQQSTSTKTLFSAARNKKSAQYFPVITALRGIAAIWVVVFHMDVIIFYRELGPLLPHDWSGLITQGYLWVDLFFILSGFIICHQYNKLLGSHSNLSNVKRYLIARFLRIYPLHLFTLILLIGFVSLVSLFFQSLIDESWHLYFEWQALTSNLLLTNAMNQHTYLSWNIVSWSIGAEWWVYVCAIFSIYFIEKYGIKFSIIIATISSIGLICLVYLHPKNNLDITFDFGFFRCLFDFTLGLTTYKAYKYKFAKAILQQDRYLFLVGVTLLAILHWRLNDLLIIPLFMVLVICSAYNQGKALCLLSHSLPQFLGKISYSIYLMHGVWFMVFWFLLPVIKNVWQIESLTFLQLVIYAITFITLTIISANYTYRYVEVPFRYLFNVKNSPLIDSSKVAINK